MRTCQQGPTSLEMALSINAPLACSASLPHHSAPNLAKKNPTLLRPQRLPPSLPTAEHTTARQFREQWNIVHRGGTPAPNVRPAMSVRAHRRILCRRIMASQHLLSSPQVRPAMAVCRHRLLRRWTRWDSLSCPILGTPWSRYRRSRWSSPTSTLRCFPKPIYLAHGDSIDVTANPAPPLTQRSPGFQPPEQCSLKFIY